MASLFSHVDIVLFLQALRLVRHAQRVRWEPLPEVVRVMVRRGGGGLGHSERRVELAVVRAVTRWHRWFGGANTCLIRSLVLGGMLTGRGNVSLNIGFRAGEEEPALDGHAWISIDGCPAGSDGRLERERYTRVLALPFTSVPGRTGPHAQNSF